MSCEQADLSSCVPEERRSALAEFAAARTGNQGGHGFRRVGWIENDGFVPRQYVDRFA